jgi:hypothetical protein
VARRSCFFLSRVLDPEFKMAALKLKVKNLDEITDDTTRALYKESDDKDGFVLDVEGAIPKGQLDEFRNSNTTLRKQLEAFKDIDPEEYKTLKAKLAELEGKTEKQKQETKEELQKQIEALNRKAVKDQDDLKAELAKRDQTIQTLMIDKEVSIQANEVGVRTEALTDVIARAKNVFKLQNGVVVAFKPDGEKWYSDTTGEILKIPEWFKILLKEAGHLFKESQGTGSTGGATGGKKPPVSTDNPWKTGNRTDQAMVIKQDIQRARLLAKEAGVRVTF